jgi:hypothetical protein
MTERMTPRGSLKAARKVRDMIEQDTFGLF